MNVSFSSKHRLQLPAQSDLESWKKADEYMKSVVTPSILSMTSVDLMNTTLNHLIYDYFAVHHGINTPKQEQNQHHHHHNHHKPHLQVTLSKIRREKNALKKKFRQAMKHDTCSKEDLIDLGKAFHDLVKYHNKLRRDVLKKDRMKVARNTIKQCSKNFWKFSEKLLSDATDNTQPSFSEDEAHQFFSHTYSSINNQIFSKPSWMQDVPAPHTPFCYDPITLDELILTLKKCRCGSSPNPLDGIPYTILKRCSSLHPALLHLYNTCLMTSLVPSQWKKAVIKLIPKSSAHASPSEPKNFRPIALTSCIGKVFTSIVKRRWDAHMTTNSYLDTTIQKAFQNRIAGCEEHQLKLSSVLRDANQHQRSLVVTWLDLANAYGSVNHHLIQFALSHYHAPLEFLALISSLYDNQQAVITCKKWETKPVDLRVGVFQGDPLSVSIFNTTINLLLDHIQHVCPNSGYRLSSTNRELSTLQYADDTCLIARSAKKCQEMLHAIDIWLNWARMEPKVPKCRALGLQSRKASDSRFFNPQLTLGSEEIPFLGNDSIPFLGMPVSKLLSATSHQESLSMKLTDLLLRVDSSPITVKQKIRLYKDGICPRLNWDFRVLELPISWIERELESKATKCLKKWMRIPQGGNSKVLYLPREDGGLALPALTTLYKQQQASRHVIFTTSQDDCIRFLETKQTKSHPKGKFSPAAIVSDVQSENITSSKRQLKSIVSQRIIDEDSSVRKSTCLIYQCRVDFSVLTMTFRIGLKQSPPFRTGK
jgi:hypothetical protein